MYYHKVTSIKRFHLVAPVTIYRLFMKERFNFTVTFEEKLLKIMTSEVLSEIKKSFRKHKKPSDKMT